MAEIEKGVRNLRSAGLLKTSSGFSPKKSLGQHFLVDPWFIHTLISNAALQASDLILEIGPGLGALTIPIARSVRHVVAVEKDKELIDLLNEKLSRAGITNVTLINKDILTFDIGGIRAPSSSKIQVIGNLPYNISSPFLEKLLENRDLIRKAVLMFQSEVARRLSASPGTKAYGALSVLVQYHALTTVLLEVPSGAFYPRPKVDSTVLELDFEQPYPRRADHEDSFRRVVKGAFVHRRKTLINSLKGLYPSWDRDTLLQGMRNCGIDPGRRAETLHMDEFLCLSSVLKLTNVHTSGREA